MRKVPLETFLGKLQSRKRELATDIIAEVDPAEMQQKGFAPAIITNMANKLRREVEDMQDLRLEFHVDKSNTIVSDQKKTDHVTQRYSAEPLVGGCCEG